MNFISAKFTLKEKLNEKYSIFVWDNIVSFVLEPHPDLYLGVIPGSSWENMWCEGSNRSLLYALHGILSFVPFLVPWCNIIFAQYLKTSIILHIQTCWYLLIDLQSSSSPVADYKCAWAILSFSKLQFFSPGKQGLVD